MAKESLGYVELEWTCPFCNTRNPGRAKVCRNCGAAQPKDVQFHQAGEDKIVTDQEGLEMAKGGPDVHCPFCGTRNPAGATKCSRCGGDLTGAEQREEGQIIGAAHTEPAPDIKCDYCGTLNPATNAKCKNCGSPLGVAVKPAAAAPTAAPAKVSPVLMIAGAIILLLICGAIAFFFMRGASTESNVARVSNVNWKRSIVVMGYAPATLSTWADELPQGAEINYCSERQRGRSAFATENSEEVCGTPYLVDQGTGFGEMVQDCEYIVYDDYCEYTIMRLQPVGVMDETGSDLNPFWPETRLQTDQELGEHTQTYQITFDINGESVVYQTTNPDEFLQFQPNSAWEVEVNGFGRIVDIRPAP